MTSYSAILGIRPDAIAYLAHLLDEHQRTVGTRAGRPALSVGKLAVLALRWFLDNTRLSQLHRDNNIGKSTGCAHRDRPHRSDRPQGQGRPSKMSRETGPRWSGSMNHSRPKTRS